MRTTDTRGVDPGSSPAAITIETRLPETLKRRVVVEHVRPAIDEGVGGFAIKRTPGETVDVTAHVFADGHDLVAAVVLWRRRRDGVRASGFGVREDKSGQARGVTPDKARGPEPEARDASWHETPMTALGNDEWSASFTIADIGEYEYTVEAWIDRFGTWRAHLEAKCQAAQDVATELVEGAALIREAAREKGSGVFFESSASGKRLPTPFPTEWLLGVAEILEDTGDDLADRVAAALDPHLADVMASRADRSLATRVDPPLRVIADRERARFGAWYEMFPRSATPDPARGATFGEAEALLPAVADMGFDIVYLAPIHPIGRTFRKGRNNSLQPAPEDPGSPWAIGGPDGGHTEVDPGLGTIADFERFVETARGLGLEIALDLAFQASPDHPHVAEHPEWFRRRPDGSIKYAENPPKKYQDIYPFDLEGAAWREVWVELERVTRFWIGHGVRIFRVDNPHTKPLGFWRWMLDGIRADHPDAIFLAEAFTRPKIMRFLAKAGFNQSYSYFTWRNTKPELTEYFEELTQTGVREYLRPNLFANTPDILHEYLQKGGRPAFRVRLILAATLGAAYGIYSGFELCENVPVKPGSEEYLDSEKYQLRPRDWDQPGHIRELIARVNDIRRTNRALQSDWSLKFYDTDNPELICYAKSLPDRSNTILVVVNLDPHHMQHGWVQVPMHDFGIDPYGSYVVRDLLDDAEYTWRGERNYVRLDPEVAVAHVFRLESGLGARPPNSEARTPGVGDDHAG